MRKIAEIPQETGIIWRHCPTDKKLADFRSRSASINKMQKGEWFEGPELLLHKEEWPINPKRERRVYAKEHKPEKQKLLYSEEKEPDQWEALLDRSKLWRTFCATAWTLRFIHNSHFKRCNTKKRSGH